MIARIGSYGLVSAFCFALNNALLIGLARLPLWLNLSLTTAVAIVVGYVLLSVFVFRASLSWLGIGRYSLVLLANMPIAFGLLWVLTQWLPMHLAAPVVTTVMLLWNAAGSRWAVRKRGVMAEV